jgi:RNA polymerase sigma-70 factor (ECF subfamily)
VSRPEAEAALAPAEGSALLVREAARRGEETFEQAAVPLWPALVRRLSLVLGDTAAAEDVAQEAYLRAFRAWGAFEGGDVRAWLYTIALRLAFNERRRRRRWLDAIRRLEPRRPTDQLDPDLLVALGRLDARVRAALLLNSIDGYTQREVGAILGAPEGTVASWISRGRAALRADLERAR